MRSLPASHIMRYLDILRIWANRVLALLAAASLLAMVCLACANIVLRAAGNPVEGTFELMGFLGALVAGFSLGYAQLSKGHIAVTILKGLLPAWFERTMDILCSLAGTLFFAAAAWQVADVAAFMVEMGDLSETLRFAYYPFVYAVSVGCAAMGLTMAVDTLQILFNCQPEEAR